MVCIQRIAASKVDDLVTARSVEYLCQLIQVQVTITNLNFFRMAVKGKITNGIILVFGRFPLGEVVSHIIYRAAVFMNVLNAAVGL